MFAYCRNNPVNRKDAFGTADVCVEDFNQDNNPFNDLGNPTGSGGGSCSYCFGAPSYSSSTSTSYYGSNPYYSTGTSSTYNTTTSSAGSTGGCGSYSTNYGSASTQMGYNTSPITIPSAAWDVLKHISTHNGAPPTGYKGGKIFLNDGRDGGQVLPDRGMPYRKYDIYPKGALSGGRGKERIVCGSDGSAWYTNDHYFSFTEMWR